MHSNCGFFHLFGACVLPTTEMLGTAYIFKWKMRPIMVKTSQCAVMQSSSLAVGLTFSYHIYGLDILGTPNSLHLQAD